MSRSEVPDRSGARPVSGRARSHLRPGILHDRPDLDDAVLRQRPRDLLGTVEAIDVDEEQPGELLLDLAERPVGHCRGAVPELDERALVAEALDPDQLAARLGLVDHYKVIDEMKATGELIRVEGLGNERTFIEFLNGAPAVTDGPFGEVKEQLAGLFLVDVDSLDRAKEIAGPISEYGVVEIRPVMEDAGAEM